VVSFVGTDNRKGGELAADLMDSTWVAVARFSYSGIRRVQRVPKSGSKVLPERLRRFPFFELIISDRCAGATRNTAWRASEALLARHANLEGVFTSNEPAIAGMLMALVSIRRAEKICFVGFDSSDIYIDRVRSRFIHGLVVQNPVRIGELGVKTLVKHIRGVSVSRRIDTRATMVTPDNMDEPDIRQLLNPQKA